MKVRDYLIAFVIVLSIQLTDLKFADIKFGEMFSVLLMGYYLINANAIKMPRIYKGILIAFTVLLLTSFLVLLWVEMFPPNLHLGLLKSPGWVSISRYIQCMGCVYFALFIHSFFSSHSSAYNLKFLKVIDTLMLGFGMLFLAVFALYFLGVKTVFVYGNGRLRGGFIEGGPFGLFMGFYLIIRTILLGPSKLWFMIAGLLLIASQSKAAILFVLLSYLIWSVMNGKIRLGRLALGSGMALITLVTVNTFFNFSDRLLYYWEDFTNVDQAMLERGDDPMLVMGRIAATYISPRIFLDNTLFGVGLGNYSLVRNNPSYRGNFPFVTEWDLTGLGGVANLLVESGIFGLIIFALPFIRFWKISALNQVIKFIMVLFFLAQFFGVQLYFQYLWFALAIATSFPAIFFKKESFNVVRNFSYAKPYRVYI